jgi:hypothetical protein
MGYMGEGNGGLGVEGKWEGEAMVVAGQNAESAPYPPKSCFTFFFFFHFVYLSDHILG